MEQVLINLLKNSLEAVSNRDKKKIEIYSELKNQVPTLGVKDNGEGIPPDQLESIFIPFYSTKKDGTGVGLSFSQHIMRLHQGQLKVNSKPGVGSDFQLIFPAD